MSLTFTLPSKALMWYFMQQKVYYSHGDQEAAWNTWAETAASSGTSAEQAAAEMYSGQTLTFMFRVSDIDHISSGTDYVKKWSGACLADVSSKMGGFCLMEQNDTNVEGTSSS